MPKTKEQIIKNMIKNKIKRVFGTLPLEAINKMTDRELLSNKNIGIKTFIYIRTLGESYTRLDKGIYKIELKEIIKDRLEYYNLPENGFFVDVIADDIVENIQQFTNIK